MLRLTEDELADLYREQTGRAASHREDCLESSVLAQLARGEIDDSQRDEAADHVASCRDCAEETGLLMRLEREAGAGRDELPRIVPPARGSSAPFSRVRAFAIAASLILPLLGITLWQWREIVDLRDRLDEASTVVGRESEPPPLVKEASEHPDLAPRVAVLEEEIERLSQPQLNPAIIDLEPDVLRGGSDTQTIRVSADASLLNLILSTANEGVHPDYALEIRDATGRVIWHGAGLRRSPYDTFVVALPARLFPGGRYAVRVLGIRGEQETLLQQYVVDILYN
jgi:hypothetical protein